MDIREIPRIREDIVLDFKSPLKLIEKYKNSQVPTVIERCGPFINFQSCTQSGSFRGRIHYSRENISHYCNLFFEEEISKCPGEISKIFNNLNLPGEKKVFNDTLQDKTMNCLQCNSENTCVIDPIHTLYINKKPVQL